WLWVLLLAYRVLVGFYRLTSHLLPKLRNEPLPRVHWEVGIGFTLLLAGTMGIEALQMASLGTHLPAGADGQLGVLLAHIMSLAFGQAGCTLLLLAMIAVGASLFFRFSWLAVSEKVGWFLETLLQIGRASCRERV